MFPIAHAWLLERIVPSPRPASYLGCIWPDMLFGGPLTHAQSHRSGALLARSARQVRDCAEHDATTADSEVAEEWRAFVAGVLTHGSEPHGFDWYSDEQYGGAPAEARGYAFQRGWLLAEDAARACGVSMDQGVDQGWWKAHNLIEMAFERELYAAHPALGDYLVAACADGSLHRRIAAQLSQVFDVDPAPLADRMHHFASVVSLAPTSADDLAAIYAKQVRLKHPGAQPDVPALAALITRAEAIIAPDAQQYLARCVADVGQMLRLSM